MRKLYTFRFMSLIFCFVLPAIFVHFIPTYLAIFINPNAYFSSLPYITLGSNKSNLITPVGEIYTNNVVSQDFLCHNDNLVGVSLLFATYARKNYGEMQIGIEDQKGLIIYSHTSKLINIVDNENAYFRFPKPFYCQEGNMITIKIAVFASKENAITVWTAVDDKYFGLKINDETIPNRNLIGKLFYTQ